MSQNKRNHWVSLFLGGCLGLLIGFGIKAMVQSSEAYARGSQEQASSRTIATLGSPAGLSLHRERTIDQLSAAIKRSNRAQRWLWLATQAEKALPADMPQLIKLAGNDWALTKMLAAHWAKLDPNHMLDHLMNYQARMLTSMQYFHRY